MLARVLQSDMDKWMFTQTKGVVQFGPFKGVMLKNEKTWPDEALSPMLLGCHEEELHGVLEEEIARLSLLPNPKIVNVGCAEGYYAVGLASRLPKATVWVIDINDEALKLAAANAAANGCDIVVGDAIENVFKAPDLVVMDCEGAESTYLDHERFPGLLKATIIVEVHNAPGRPPNDNVLFQRWKGHDSIVAYFEGPRNPNKFKMLIDKPSIFRWSAVCENRPCAMGWFVMRPK